MVQRRRMELQVVVRSCYWSAEDPADMALMVASTSLSSVLTWRDSLGYCWACARQNEMSAACKMDDPQTDSTCLQIHYLID